MHTCPKCGHEFEPKRELPPRAKEALPMVVDGLSNKEIGAIMHVEERTVKAYVAQAMRHYGVQNRVQLAVLIYRAQKEGAAK